VSWSRHHQDISCIIFMLLSGHSMRYFPCQKGNSLRHPHQDLDCDTQVVIRIFTVSSSCRHRNVQCALWAGPWSSSSMMESGPSDGRFRMSCKWWALLWELGHGTGFSLVPQTEMGPAWACHTDGPQSQWEADLFKKRTCHECKIHEYSVRPKNLSFFKHQVPTNFSLCLVKGHCCVSLRPPFNKT
jgi:hypothetical protein